MRKLEIAAATLLTFLFFSLGYAIEFLNTFVGRLFGLPGPYSDGPMAWVWFAINIVIIALVSWAFCRQIIRRAEKNTINESTFL
ncbi:hypothetical protein MTsPCn3_04440 [Erythrobacter sp. MTPC3]